MKTCSLCKISRPLAEFSPDRSCRGGVATQCKLCRSRRRRERWAHNVNGCRDKQQAAYAADPEKRAAAARAAALRSKWRITEQEYDALLEAQGAVCALCREPERKVHHKTGQVLRLAVDHDHRCCPTQRTCGQCIRGLLCYECNLLVGKIEQKPELVKRFEDYLSRRSMANLGLR